MLQGIGVSHGCGIGRALVAAARAAEFTPRDGCDPALERARLAQAEAAFTAHNKRLAAQVRQELGQQESEILLGHVMMLQDPSLQGQIDQELEAGHCAEQALAMVCDRYIALFSSVDDAMTQQRAADIRDIKEEILSHLTGTARLDLRHLPPETVLVTRELTPSLAAQLDRRHVTGIITELGGETSHGAILARAMDLPAVLGVPDAMQQLANAPWVIVDGDLGHVLPDPPEATLAQYRAAQARDAAARAAREAFRGRATTLADGGTVRLFGNITSPDQAKLVCDNDGEGVGLFRTEFLFLDRQTPPDEQTQLAAYRQVLQQMAGKPVIIRTLDIGGDKEAPCLAREKEENPFLGFRGIRYCLRRQDLFKTQLRALARASADGPLSILLPMVTGVEEVRAARALLRGVLEELEADGIACDQSLHLGVMIETPAAALTADLLAQEADFFSIGTNDLTGYTMAADRGNANVAYLYTPLSPAVLRAIRGSIAAAKAAGIPVGMCGEAAADPRLIPLLLSFGLEEFSVSPNAVLETRRQIARWSKADADAIAAEVMAQETTQDVQVALARLMEV